jgi:hypothetical protein
MTESPLAYYASHSQMSDPGPLASWLEPAPRTPVGIADLVAGLVLHPVFVERRRVTLPPEAESDRESPSVREILRRILGRDGRPLTTRRPAARRFVGTCRDYALLACAIFRHQGTPARLRVGFADYFVPGFHEDHWLCEYRDGATWRLLDAELDDQARRDYRIDFDPVDVPRERFLTAGQAWLAVRHGRLDTQTFGVSFVGIAGAWFVAGSVLRDLAALNKEELLPWDYWGLGRALSPASGIADRDAARLDRLAALLAGGDPEWAVLRATYAEDDALRVPAVVLSFPRSAPIEVRLPTAEPAGQGSSGCRIS